MTEAIAGEAASSHQQRIAIAKALTWDINTISPDDVREVMARLAVEGFVLRPLFPDFKGQPPVKITARPLSEWHEDDGFVTWWKFPVDEPSYIGSPLCTDWPGYHTHWTPHPDIPSAPDDALDNGRWGAQ